MLRATHFGVQACTAASDLPVLWGANPVDVPMWGCIKTNLAIFGGMNIHLPVIWGSLGYQGFDSYPCQQEEVNVRLIRFDHTWYETRIPDHSRQKVLLTIFSVATTSRNHRYVHVNGSGNGVVTEMAAVIVQSSFNSILTSWSPLHFMAMKAYGERDIFQPIETR